MKDTQHNVLNTLCALGVGLAGVLLTGAVHAQNNGVSDAHRLAIGTPVKVTLLQNVSSETTHPGDHVQVRVAHDDTSGLPHGTVFYGRVLDVRPATAHRAGDVEIRFDNGTDYNSPDFVNDEASAHLTGQTPTSDHSNYMTYGAGGGALLGLLRAGKVGDALEGAALGALGGYAANQATKHSASDVSLKRGSEITMRLDRPLTLHTAINAY